LVDPHLHLDKGLGVGCNIDMEEFLFPSGAKRFGGLPLGEDLPVVTCGPDNNVAIIEPV